MHIILYSPELDEIIVSEEESEDGLAIRFSASFDLRFDDGGIDPHKYDWHFIGFL